MAAFSVLAGVLITLALVVVLLPWLRSTSSLLILTANPRASSLIAITVVVVTLGLYRGFGHFDVPSQPVMPVATGAVSPAGFAEAAKEFSRPAATVGEAATPGAEPMEASIAKLESRLAQGGGSDGDWELLAKSFEFLGRPQEAAKARSHELPP